MIWRLLTHRCARYFLHIVASYAITLPCHAATADPQPADPRLREVIYSPNAVVTVPVKRGVVALVVLDGEETIAELAAGLGGDCAKPESAWCITAQPGGRHFFVKAKSQASGTNNVVVVTDRRHHSFRFVVLPDDDMRQPVFKLSVRAPAPPVAPATSLKASIPSDSRPATQPAVPDTLLPLLAGLLGTAAASPPPPQQHLVHDRLLHKPQVLNTHYTLSEGVGAQDIVPTLVFDDGRFTYFRFPGHRELPAVFHVLANGSETLVNARMEEDLLVVDRVSRRLMLRAGSAAVGIWNEAFDIEGDGAIHPPGAGTSVPGVERVLKAPGGPRRPSTGLTGTQP